MKTTRTGDLRTSASAPQCGQREGLGCFATLHPLLRCPYCHNAFHYRELSAGFGLLNCDCDRWPVVDGIPILLRSPVALYEHTRGDQASAGVTVKELVRLIELRAYQKALLRCLVYPLDLPRLSRLSWRTSQVLGRFLCTRQLKRLLARRQQVTAREVFGFFFRDSSPLGSAVGDYFLMHAGQPRYLAALALLEQIPCDSRPVLDLACGAGHFEHYLNASGRTSLGIDLNFFQVWIARHWIAPASVFICADLRDGIPIADDSMAAIFCSDAYHYIRNRAQSLTKDIERCAPGRMMILTRVGNREVMPNEGTESDVAGYLAELGSGALVFHEAGLVRDYLARRAPRSEQAVAQSKWLSFVRHAPPFVDPTGWPHALGVQGINPIYQQESSANGVRLRFRFPGVWYAYENAEMLRYHPRMVELTQAELAQLLDRGSEVSQRLIRQFVLVGLPQRFG